MARHGSTVVWVLLLAGLVLLPVAALAQDGNQTGQNETNESDGADGNGTSGGDPNASDPSQGNASTEGNQTGENASTQGNDTGFGGGQAPGMPSGERNNSSSFTQGGADGDPTAEAYTVWGTLVAAVGALTAAAFRV